MRVAFPLATLQPVADTRNVWVGLLLELSPAPEDDALAVLCGEYGLAEALGPLPCIVTLLDLNVDLSPLPAEKAILRLPIAFLCDRANDGALDELVAKGFRLMGSGLPLVGKLPHPAVHSLALPCPGHGAPVGVGEWLSKLPGPHVALGAEQITCSGRCYFQWLAGNFPQHLKPGGGKPPEATHRALLLELLAAVASDADSHRIEATIKRDPQLSYNLLKLVNSVAFSLPSKIGSFSQAITLLGRRQLQRWLQLLLYAHPAHGEAANPLLPQAALRAGLAEALCEKLGGSRDEQDKAFMVGMFSLLDTLFGIPLTDIVKPLNLAEDVAAALVSRSGRLGQLLQAVEAGEHGSHERLAPLLAEAGVSNEGWFRSLAHAAQWAVQVSREA